MGTFVPQQYQQQYREMLANRAREDAKLEGELARLRAGSIPATEVVTAGPTVPVPLAPSPPLVGLAWNVGNAEQLPLEGDFSQIYGQEKTQPRTDSGHPEDAGGASGQQKRRTKKRRSKKIPTRKKARSPSGKKRSRAKKTPRKKATRKK